jgi:phosphatidylserine/phosphatidylglycerophosphate/cardiolipin synthase-like enzyme
MSLPTILSLGQQRISGTYFIPRDLVGGVSHQVQETGHRWITHVATDDLTRTAHIRSALIESIRAAREKVYFCSFLFADDAIVAALCEAAQRLRGGVYVLAALQNHLRFEAMEPEGELTEQEQKFQRRAQQHVDHLNRLAEAGVWVRSTNDCHAKFCVVDDAVAIITSANATEEAYTKNPEDGLVVQDGLVAGELGRLFAHVWLHLADLESQPGTLLNVRTRPLGPVRPWRPLTHKGAVSLVATLRRQEDALLQAALQVLDGAQTRLTLASYSLVGMENHPVGLALERAIKRGVEVDLLLQPKNHSAAQRATCQWLTGIRHGGVRLHGHSRTHTKSLVADGRDVLLWTGNLDSAHGWEDGIEVGLRIQDSGVAQAIEAWVREVIQRSTLRPLEAPSAAELAEATGRANLAGCYDLILPPMGDNAAILAALEHLPAEWLELGDAQMFRLGGAMVLDVRVEAATNRIEVLGVRRGPTPRCSRLGWISGVTLRVTAPRAQAKEGGV